MPPSLQLGDLIARELRFAAAATLLVLALLASWAGARRATRVDPVEALRCE